MAKETGRRLGLVDHMYPAKVLQGPLPGSQHATLDEMIIDADGFAGMFPEHKYEIVKRLQGIGYLCAMTGDGVNDAPALSRANVGVAVERATDAARGAADIVLTEPFHHCPCHPPISYHLSLYEKLRHLCMVGASHQYTQQ